MRSRLCRAAGLAARSLPRADATSLPALGARGFAAAAGCEAVTPPLDTPAAALTPPLAHVSVVETPSRAKALLLLLPGGVAAGLGAWQLQRREWKEEQLAERARQLGAEPLPLRAVAGAGVQPAGEWRRVLCKGELRHDAAAYVRHPKPRPSFADAQATRPRRAGGASSAHHRRHRMRRLPAGALPSSGGDAL